MRPPYTGCLPLDQDYQPPPPSASDFISWKFGVPRPVTGSHCVDVSLSTHDIVEQLRVCTYSCCGVPACVRDFASVWNFNSVLQINTGASERATLGDVIKRLAGSGAVEPWVDEAHRWLAGAEASIVEKSDDRGYDW